MSLISRKLLTPDEVLKIESPYILVMIAGKPPALLNVPDISKMHFNKLNGMGTEEENQILRIEREKERPIRKISKPKIWNIWDKLKTNKSSNDEMDLVTFRNNWIINKKMKEVKSDEKKEDD